ncbi:WXG100 family type VII secretion target [Saccharopolyspora karakumensis]|uniref:WXG100 family type VII secretion target n=1 Tax=Saccharopolyspora karakumensis TaxID=2530386 RepID=A0A4R5BGW5_9PSEU|nr:type VII secretion target [Saccharopolyspora karakumensis]TDD84955.1 WXG100 family type VII secretion target [Saccharopolyspora karakumensis]
MTMKVAPEALSAHSRGSDGVSQHLDQLAQVLEQARVSDDCFGPLGELMAFAYFDSLEECRDLATKAGGFMQHIAQAVADCAKDYAETDQKEADNLGGIDIAGLGGAGSGPGTIGGVNGAGGARRGFMDQTAAYGMSTASAAQDLAKAENPPDIAIATVNARMEQLQLVTSPGQSFVDNGLGFLISLVISPLVEFVLEPAIGDPEQMRATAKGWEQVAEWLEKLGEQEQQRAEATRPAWEGQAGDAFRKQMTEFTDGSRAFATDVLGLKQMLELAADLFDAFVEMVIDIIQELVLGLIIEWIAALAASWITAGASVGAATGMTAGQVAITGTRLGTKVAELLHKLKPLVTKLEELLVQLRRGPLRQVVEKMNDLRGGNVAQRWVSRQIDANPLAKTLTRGDHASLGRAQDAVRDAERAVTEGRPNAVESLADARERLARAEANDMASTTGNRFARQEVTDATAPDVRRSWSGDLSQSARGEQALATNAVQAGLGTVGLGGQTRVTDAVLGEGLQTATEQGIEQGVKYGYDKAAEPSSSEERQAAENRGFEM